MGVKSKRMSIWSPHFHSRSIARYEPAFAPATAWGLPPTDFKETLVAALHDGMRSFSLKRFGSRSR